MQIETISIGDLKPYEKNAKTHPKKQVDLLAENISRFGFTTPVLVDKDNNVIAGHGRLLALKQIGRTEVPCVRMEHLSDEEVKALRLADNKIAELGEWDMDLAIEELKGLDEDLLDLTGFDSDLIIEPDEKDDEVPDVPEEPVSMLGDLYELGNHRVLCGDSTKIEDVERLMDGKKADMVFTDPPYGMNLDTDYSKLPDSNRMGKAKTFSKVIGDDEEFDFNKVATPNCVEQLWWGANYYRRTLPKGGNWIVWDKREEEKFDRMIGSGFELAWTSQKHKQKIYRHNNTLFSGKAEAKNKVHPTQKPTMLIVEILNDWNIQGLLVDLFLGSGSTLIASEKTGRICYGMELDPKYVDVIVSRYVEYTGNSTIKKNGEEIIWETAQKQQKE